jgi:multiple sugar transport system permease protein
MSAFNSVEAQSLSVQSPGVWTKIRREIRRSNKWGYVFIAPLLIDFLIFTLYMVFRVGTMAFQDINFGQITWVGFQHFQEVLKAPQFWNAMKNTTVYTVAVVPGEIFVALVLAEFIFRRSKPVQILYKSAYYIPAVVSTVVLSIVWTWIYQPFSGILNYFVGFAGVSPQNWLGNPNTAMAAVIIMTIVSGIGVPVVFITAAMGSIPTELYDAASIDGASDWVRFWRITVPLLRPTLLYLSVVGFIGTFQVFEQIYIMTQGGPGFPAATETVGYLIYTSAFTSLNFGKAAAQSIILFFAILIFSIAQFRIFAADVEY